MIAALILLMNAALEPYSSLQIGGDFRSAVSDSALLYVADGRGVSVFSGQSLERLGGCMIAGRISLIARRQDRLFVGGTRGLAVIKVDDCLKINPEIAWLHTKPLSALTLSGDTLWFADAQGGVYGLDARTDKELASFGGIMPAAPIRIIPNEGRLYLAADSAGLYTIDLEAKEPRAGKIDIEGNPAVMDVLFTSNNAYIACAEEGLWVLKPKRNAFKVDAKVETRGELMCLELFDKRIAAAAGTGDFQLFSIENPDNPVLIQEESFHGSAVGLAKAPESVFVLSGIGVGKMDMKTSPLAGRGLAFKAAGSGHDILCRGQIAVLAAGEAGVRTISVGEKLSFLGGYTGSMAPCLGLNLSGTHVYTTTTTNRMWVVEIKDPANPDKRGFLQFKSSTRGMDAEGEMLLTAEQELGVGIWWHCACGPFKEQGRWSFGGRALDVKIHEKLAFVSTDPAALYVIDWSDSTRPEEVTKLDLSRDYERLYLDGDLLFGLDEDGTLAIINVARSTRPKELGMLELEGSPVALVRYADKLFVAAQDSGVLEIDISEPESPRYLETFDVWGASGVAVSGDLLLVSTPYAVEAYRIKP